MRVERVLQKAIMAALPWSHTSFSIACSAREPSTQCWPGAAGGCCLQRRAASSFVSQTLGCTHTFRFKCVTVRRTTLKNILLGASTTAKMFYLKFPLFFYAQFYFLGSWKPKIFDVIPQGGGVLRVGSLGWVREDMTTWPRELWVHSRSMNEMSNYARQNSVWYTCSVITWTRFERQIYSELLSGNSKNIFHLT